MVKQLIFVIYAAVLLTANAFTIISPCAPLLKSTELYAKNKGSSSSSSGKGFGKVESSSIKKDSVDVQPMTAFSEYNLASPGGLTSVEGAKSYDKPKMDLDPNMSTTDRTKEILKQQYGLRSLDEKQADIIAAQRAREARLKIEKAKQMKDEEFDIFMVVPPPILKAIDFFLKAGLTITTILFVLAGIGITAEAWSAATGGVLPENLDSFIVNVVEPNFTTGLFVLLGFSISLGLFATAQLGSGSSIYREKI